MPVCEVCQNAQAVIFEIVVGGKSHLFDSFECAIHALWPSSEAAASGGSPAESPRPHSPPPESAR
jgi:hypothetical protein